MVTSVRIAGVDLQAVADKLPAEAMAFLQNDTTLVYKGSFMVDVMDIMLTPIIDKLMTNK
ncbi:Phosphoribulokinase [hydrothermal vent metagenome]|uniref:Phosphoribulokinase n=1 Tax=hydrothermal vent metagenome TaxID=652676 RepID=A0A1W1DUI4_9ZZZZ